MRRSLIFFLLMVGSSRSFTRQALRGSLRSIIYRRSLRSREANDCDPDPNTANLESLKVYNSKSKNKVRDGRESLPYFLDVISPPPRRLGCFSLDAATKSGDLVQCESRYYEVARVRSQYRYRSGMGFVMVKKNCDLKEASRAMEERWLGRVMNIEASETNSYLE